MNGHLRMLTRSEHRAPDAPRTDIELAVLSDEQLSRYEVPLPIRLIRALEGSIQELELARGLAQEMEEGDLHQILISRITELDGNREVLIEREAEK